MKKRVIAGVLAFSMAMLLGGCGSSGTSGSAQQGSQAVSSEAGQPQGAGTEGSTAASAADAAADAQAEGAGAGGETENTAREGSNEIVIGISQDLDDSLDPHLAVAAGTREVMFNVFEGLVKPSPEGELVPAVASDYEVSADGLTYTFTLRDGVLFHNGNPVEAEDVLYSIQRNADDKDGEALIPALSAISDMQADGNVISITLEEANNEFLSSMTLAVLPRDYDKQDTEPVGTGPFRFVSRTAQDSIVLEKFADYWGTPAYLDKVTYKIIENAEGLLLGLQSGALDLVAHLSITQAAQLDTNVFGIEEGTMNLVQALYLNNAAAPFDDVRVRQALCYGVDRQAILDIAFDGYGVLLGSGMYPAFKKYFDDSLTDYYPYDPAKAQELLAEAGYPDGFSMTITVPSNYQPHMDTAEVLVEQLRGIGVNAEILPVEWATWLSDVYADTKYESTVIGLTANEMTARSLLERFTSTASNNFINYRNSDYDALFEEAASTYDDAAQTQIYRDMERNLTENAASLYIQDMADLVAVRKGLTGLRFYPLYVLDVSTLRWAE